MAHRDVVVVGASSGSVEALTTLLSRLPHDLPAARTRGHESIAEIFEERARVVDSDVRTIHDLIINSDTLEPVGQESA